MVSTNQFFSGFAFTGFVLASVLLPLHVKAKNIGTCALIIWIGLLCLNGFVNSIVWDHSVTDWAPVWCDISSHLMIGGGIGVQSACLCITRHLYLVTRNITTNRLSQVTHWRATACDYFFVIGVPVLYIVLSYIFQVRRFMIYEEIGCYFALYNTQPMYPLLLIWPFIVSLILIVYLGVTIRTLTQRGAGFKKLIQHDEQFFRLLALAVVIVTCTFPYSLWAIVANATENPVSPWPGWDIVHANISHVVKVPAAEWQAQIPAYVTSIQFTRWTYVVYAIIVFSFFGFTTEARQSYRAMAGFLTRCFGTLAIFKGRKMRQKRSPAHRMPVNASQISDHQLCPHTASAVDSLQRDSCLIELSDPSMGSVLDLVRDTEATRYPGSDGDAQHAYFATSVLEHPAPVLDIVSVLRCHSPDSNLV
ncbi:hypothetical protein SERLA73DRAFT_91071 [Serpula lacrymans var. lacrymans S7.3]|uniref:Uncharacterized protein n=2 Tax=Serpula lacrymans var. lacrymans TaxID=341189 RepID=F8Q0T8_SERL3|nr:uncharacterized protein SERLADRAFT_361873 [Serpula lacrymans var. lacrymans S7.9]EGN97917.1 hypothetical protein SERLA73DRAFT_91071 [Serpula lacrymans var. lacrymans S7.3]EGO23503.1 hypothetical protein SERLADRAFT_361873 [Serpula lacrymans var. lacrymans S7.9]